MGWIHSSGLPALLYLPCVRHGAGCWGCPKRCLSTWAKSLKPFDFPSYPQPISSDLESCQVGEHLLAYLTEQS